MKFVMTKIADVITLNNGSNLSSISLTVSASDVGLDNGIADGETMQFFLQDLNNGAFFYASSDNIIFSNGSTEFDIDNIEF